MRRARFNDSRAIAQLHRKVITWGLLTQLGEDVVTAFYEAVTTSPAAFCYVATQRGALQGFAAGVCVWPRLRWGLLRRGWWPLVRAVPRLLATRRWRRLWETGRYTRSGYEGVQAEFLSIGVRADFPGRIWAGAALAAAVVREFRRRGVTRIRGVVWHENERALRFFEAVGFRFVSDIEIHPGERSRTFVVDLTTHA